MKWNLAESGVVGSQARPSVGHDKSSVSCTLTRSSDSACNAFRWHLLSLRRSLLSDSREWDSPLYLDEFSLLEQADVKRASPSLCLSLSLTNQPSVNKSDASPLLPLIPSWRSMIARVISPCIESLLWSEEKQLPSDDCIIKHPSKKRKCTSNRVQLQPTWPLLIFALSNSMKKKPSISDIRQTQQINIKLSFIPVIRPERYDHHRLSYLDARFDLFSSLLAARQSCELNLVTSLVVNRHKPIYVCVCVYIVGRNEQR